MEIGIGLANTLHVPGPGIAERARRAEERGFHAVATIDRIVYPNYDSLTALAVAAGATSRIGLMTNILLGALYPPVWLAKAALSLDAMSGGRLTLGVAVGGREDDFVAMGRDMHRRGRLLDEALDVLRRAGQGEPVAGGEFAVGPAPASPGGVPVLVGGGDSEAVLRRTVRYGAGWAGAAGGPDMVAPVVAKVRAAWQAAGREGEPRIAALVYYGLSDEGASYAALKRYYGFLGEWADAIAGSALRSPQAVKDAARAFADAGVTELVFNPTVTSLDEVDRLADAVL